LLRGFTGSCHRSNVHTARSWLQAAHDRRCTIIDTTCESPFSFQFPKISETNTKLLGVHYLRSPVWGKHKQPRENYFNLLDWNGSWTNVVQNCNIRLDGTSSIGNLDMQHSFSSTEWRRGEKREKQRRFK